MIKGVITGDLVNSTNIAAEWRQTVLDTLNVCVAPDFDKMCTYKITYPNFQAFSKNNLCKWVTQRLFFVSLHHVCT